MEFERNRKVSVVRSDYSSLQRILKQAFEIVGEIIHKYEADWEDFVDLDDFEDVKLKVVFESLLVYKFYIMRASHCLSLNQHDQ